MTDQATGIRYGSRVAVHAQGHGGEYSARQRLSPSFTGVAFFTVHTLGQVGTVRVDIEHLEQKTFRVTTSNREEEFTFLMDEPAVRGGQNKGPTPLAFFIAGAGG